jgi:hypothetical protein
LIDKSPPEAACDRPPEQPADAPWPPLDPRRVSDAAAELAAQVDEPALRAQLHGLATAIGCLPAQQRVHADRDELRRALELALRADEEDLVIAAARRLAAYDRSVAQAVDWSAVSGG